MKSYEFATQVSTENQLPIPDRYTNQLPLGKWVRVIVFVNEPNWPTPCRAETTETSGFSLAEVIAEIKNTPQNPANILPAREFSKADMKHWCDMPDPAFDASQWNREWDQLEEQMKVMDLREAEKWASDDNREKQ